MRGLLMLPAGLCLLAGLDAALVLAGVWAPVPSARLADVHGPVMVLGFLGTLIALERAVALRHPLAFAAPVLLGAGGLTLVAGAPRTLGFLLLAQGLLALVVVYLALHRRSGAVVVAVELTGAALAACAVVVLLVGPVSRALPALIAFIVLTIAAERVELARIAMPASGETVLGVFAAVIALATALALAAPGVGVRLLAALLLALVAWLLRHDVARRLIRSRGLPRFSAAALLAAYAWLAFAGLALLGSGPVDSGPVYDAVVHAVFLGFAMSMVMAHAPVIFPAVLRRPLPYRRALWLPLVVLHVGLWVRVVPGDMVGVRALWRGGAITTVVALLAFVAVAVTIGVAAGARRASRRTAGTSGRTPATPSALVEEKA
ncbi:hypothetical protein GCM10028815_17860 [Mariniluteicoccus flavus]